uniref:Uncharacterized protein n=1 Tax=Medicago truncatula TaxID=3880 RepID=I3T6H5_MEDTR|nr:unknown [Medicago truncatula]
MLLLVLQFLADQPLEMDHSPPLDGADQLGMLFSWIPCTGECSPPLQPREQKSHVHLS